MRSMFQCLVVDVVRGLVSYFEIVAFSLIFSRCSADYVAYTDDQITQLHRKERQRNKEGQSKD